MIPGFPMKSAQEVVEERARQAVINATEKTAFWKGFAIASTIASVVHLIVYLAKS